MDFPCNSSCHATNEITLRVIVGDSIAETLLRSLHTVCRIFFSVDSTLTLSVIFHWSPGGGCDWLPGQIG